MRSKGLTAFVVKGVRSKKAHRYGSNVAMETMMQAGQLYACDVYANKNLILFVPGALELRMHLQSIIL